MRHFYNTNFYANFYNPYHDEEISMSSKIIELRIIVKSTHVFFGIDMVFQMTTAYFMRLCKQYFTTDIGTSNEHKHPQN